MFKKSAFTYNIYGIFAPHINNQHNIILFNLICKHIENESLTFIFINFYY